MRCLLAALGLIGLLSQAFAADYELPTLRGSETFVPAFPTYFRWEGGYIGGQIGYSSSGTDFGNGVSPLIDFALRNTRINQDINVSQLTVLGKRDTNGAGFGGFMREFNKARADATAPPKETAQAEPKKRKAAAKKKKTAPSKKR